MHIAIVEDDAAASAQAVALLKQYAQTHEPTISWLTYRSAEAFLFALPDQAFDLLLLDIRLGGQDGVTLAKTIRQRDANLAIAFLSNYEQYVFDGYDVDALAYIMKPLTLEKLTGLLTKAMARVQPEALMLNLHGNLERIYLYDIRYVEASGHYLTIHTQTADLTLKDTLDHLQTQLIGSNFVRVHRAFVVNLNFVSSLEAAELTLNDGTAIPVARSKRSALKDQLLQHYRTLNQEERPHS